MAQRLIDQNGVISFVDQNGVQCFLDENGNFTCDNSNVRNARPGKSFPAIVQGHRIIN